MRRSHPEMGDGGAEHPILNIEGELVALGPLNRELLPLYQRWINDFEALRTLGAFLPRTLEDETKWYDGWVTSETVVPFTIYALPERLPIGTASLFEVDHRNRTAVFGIFVGDSDSRGKGYGTETARLMLDYAFTVLGLHNVMLTVLEFNQAGIRAYQNAGFKEFGRRRQSHLSGGKLWDEIQMDCLSTEFERPVTPGKEWGFSAWRPPGDTDQELERVVPLPPPNR
jgi:RimJ/RimL family protein N-acetyltransferase